MSNIKYIIISEYISFFTGHVENHAGTCTLFYFNTVTVLKLHIHVLYFNEINSLASVLLPRNCQIHFVYVVVFVLFDKKVKEWKIECTQ